MDPSQPFRTINSGPSGRVKATLLLLTLFKITNER